MKKMFFIVLSLLSSLAMASTDFCAEQLDLVSRIKNNNLTFCEELAFKNLKMSPKDFVEKSANVNLFCEKKQILEKNMKYIDIFENAKLLNEMRRNGMIN